jgi:hypothetical protein
MATILFSALGAAAGASVGGGVLGLSSVVIGRAVGATVGRVIDQRVLGSGSQAVDTGRIDRFRVSGASEGASIARVFGRARIAGQVIWASPFHEERHRSGGKGLAPRPSVTEHSYSVSLAIALCEGVVSRVGRIWADGQEIAADDLPMRFYPGSNDQMPDPAIEAALGIGASPAFRGTAYVVFENLPLGAFGNRVPQFTFEVFRPAPELEGLADEPSRAIQAVAMIPGTGEYALATTVVHYDHGLGDLRSANVHTPLGITDFSGSLAALSGELPNCGSVSLVVSWFGDDLRCGECQIEPKVEQKDVDGREMPWNVSGITRSSASIVSYVEGRAVYGATPADYSVNEAIRTINASGKSVMFYPFILMEQLAGNTLPDPWRGDVGQPALPWRGRITLAAAPGQVGSQDGLAGAAAEVAAFFGTAQITDFTITAAGVSYHGPAEFSYRRFVLHYAHLCAAAGGVGAFCIGSEMRSLTHIRGAGGTFPAVTALRALAADVRAILGPSVKIGYAADWSEYFGYHPGNGDVLFHLDPLWADENIDFVGIDNYMPIADWRDGMAHKDASWDSIHNLEYLKANIEGGEGFAWYYPSTQAAALQLREPITDGAYGEDWVWRFKDIRSWWSQAHHNRIDGVRAQVSTEWVPQSKPIWFTELGCAAIDKGANEPNRFLGVHSSESGLPKFSNGRRDDFMQMQYLRSMAEYWQQNNPVSAVYGGTMLDMSRAHIWAYDARPFPWFPNDVQQWGDGGNYAKGHWLNGRTVSRSLASVVAELCLASGVADFDVSKLYGCLVGYVLSEGSTARAALQSLMVAFGFDAIEAEGKIQFRSRIERPNTRVIDTLSVVVSQDGTGVELARAPEAEMAGKVRLSFTEGQADYEAHSAEAIFPDETARSVSSSETPLVLNPEDGQAITERWLAESRVARDALSVSLPLSSLGIGAGDLIDFQGASYRIDRVEQRNALAIEAVRIEPSIYQPSDSVVTLPAVRGFVSPAPVFSTFMDLPLLTGDEVPNAPHIAVSAKSWPGSAAVYSSVQDADYALNRIINRPAIIGQTEAILEKGCSGRMDRSNVLRVKLTSGSLSSATELGLLNGANLAAIGSGSSNDWEILQFGKAALVATDTYELSELLRGQAGSDALVPELWPIGSLFVVLDAAITQLELSASSRGLARHYRIGPAQRAYSDPSYQHQVQAFDGIGLRPYSVVHLKAQKLVGSVDFGWVRRTRIEGDSWEGIEVPLGEVTESYKVQVRKGNVILRETLVASPQWSYSLSQAASDGATGLISVGISQVSQSFGAGPAAYLSITI